MQPADLTESLILQNSTPESFGRGVDYFDHGAVLSVVRQGDQILSEVIGSRGDPYAVTVTFQSTDIDATCTCPYSYGGWCKHIVAALLAYLDLADTIEEGPKLDDLLEQLSQDQLREVLLQIVRRQPALANVVEREIVRLQLQSGAKAEPSQAVTVDANAYRRKVHTIVHGFDRMRPSEAYWHMGEVAGQVGGLIEDSRLLIQQGDGRGALAVLDAITDEYVNEWTLLDDSDGFLGAVFSDLGAVWMEALLTDDLTQEEREDWADRLEVWNDELMDYGVEGFWGTAEAARQGWDHPAVQALLRGEEMVFDSDDLTADEEIVDVYDPELINARLNVLERRGRFQEFLNLASVTGERARYAAMLARLGRTDEAVTYARANLESRNAVYLVALSLWDRGESEAALAIAEFGLTLPAESDHWHAGPNLAIWLRDQASGLGQRERAMTGAIEAFKQTEDLPNYLKVKELAGDDWPRHKPDLLEALRRSTSFSRAGHVDIWLHEGMIDQAIVEADRAKDYRLTERVARAAIEAHPDWVIKVSQREAEEIIGAGRSELYGTAVHWLDLARSAYPTERLPEWLAYLDDLIERHKRKHKLRPMLEALRNASVR